MLYNLCSAQEDSILIEGTMNPSEHAAAYVAILGNLNQEPILAQSIVKNGAFRIMLSPHIPLGIYKIGFAMQEKVNFYFVHEGLKKYTLDFVHKNTKWFFESNTGNAHRCIASYWKKEDTMLQPVASLYQFVGTYPFKNAILYKDAIQDIDYQLKKYYFFRDSYLRNIPKEAYEILTNTKPMIFPPLWNEKDITDSICNAFGKDIPDNDTNYYKKPFFSDKLNNFFSSILEDKQLDEESRFKKIKEKISCAVQNIQNLSHKDIYYNLMIRFFYNANYPFLVEVLDMQISDSKNLLSDTDKKYYDYRMAHYKMIKNKKFNYTKLDSLIPKGKKDKLLLFVGTYNEPSFKWLQKIKTELENSKMQVYTVLFDESAESIQNFKSKFPTWKCIELGNENNIELIENLKLVFTPTVHHLDGNNLFIKEYSLFDRIRISYE